MTPAKKEDAPFAGLLPENLVEWAKGKTIESLQAIDLDGTAYIPETIARWDLGKKALVEVEIYVRIPGTLDLTRARVAALSFLAKEAKRDPVTFEEAHAIKIFGTDYWEHIERLHVFERIIRRRSDPAIPYMTVENLDACHPLPAFVELDERIAVYRRLLDRRLDINDLNDEGVFWALVHSIAERKNLSPLVVIAGRAHESFVVSMASQLEAFRLKQSSAE